MDPQPYEQTYCLIQQLAGPFTGQMQVAAWASHNEAEFRSRITRLAELSQRAHELAAAEGQACPERSRREGAEGRGGRGGPGGG